MNPHQRWTQSAISDLRARLSDGERVDQIAIALGRTELDVATIMSRLRLKVKMP